MNLLNKIHHINRSTFKNQSFREGQLEIIQECFTNRDVFVLMPTGGGKSLCYQLPMVCQEGIGIVISPLIALMKDQVENLHKLNIVSKFINSFNSVNENQSIIESLLNENTDIKILYVTPERIDRNEDTKKLLRSLYDKRRINLIAIDEAHCVIDWGNDFRPSYQELGPLRKEFTQVPFMALTATCSPRHTDDVIRKLQMKNVFIWKAPFNRSNIFYAVEQKQKADHSYQRMSKIIRTFPKNSSGLIYCSKIAQCNIVATELNKLLEGYTSLAVYHGQQEFDDRNTNHIKWSDGTIPILCATSAFGMGIDKQDVRFVIHFTVPKSYSYFYQEGGRGGRDGKRSLSVLFYSELDVKSWVGFLKKNKSQEEEIIQYEHFVNNYCKNLTTCRRLLLMNEFGDEHFFICNNSCDNCRNLRYRLSNYYEADVTDQCKELISFMTHLNRFNSNLKYNNDKIFYTKISLCKVWQGTADYKTIKDKRVKDLVGFGMGSRYTYNECLSWVDLLVEKGYFYEKPKAFERQGKILNPYTWIVIVPQRCRDILSQNNRERLTQNVGSITKQIPLELPWPEFEAYDTNHDNGSQRMDESESMDESEENMFNQIETLIRNNSETLLLLSHEDIRYIIRRKPKSHLELERLKFAYTFSSNDFQYAISVLGDSIIEILNR